MQKRNSLLIINALLLILIIMLANGSRFFKEEEKKESGVINTDPLCYNKKNCFFTQEEEQAGKINNNQQEEGKECLIREETRIVRGVSMEPLIKNGEAVKLLINYYKCNPVQRGDIIIHQFSKDESPIIKAVKGISGDKLYLEEFEKGKWHIFINGQVAVNSTGEPYEIGEAGKKMLDLYIRDYKGIIPKDAYLILGDKINGSFDSTAIGLVSRNDFLGKVVDSF